MDYPKNFYLTSMYLHESLMRVKPYLRPDHEILLLQSQGKFLTKEEKERVKVLAEKKRKENKKPKK